MFFKGAEYVLDVKASIYLLNCVRIVLLFCLLNALITPCIKTVFILLIYEILMPPLLNTHSLLLLYTGYYFVYWTNF